MTEKSLQTKLVNWFKKNKIYYIKIISASMAGNPDYVCIVNGRFVAIECKSSEGKQSELQKLRQKEIEESGGKYVLLNPENFNYETGLLL
jgi:hypothetical protein